MYIYMYICIYVYIMYIYTHIHIMYLYIFCIYIMYIYIYSLYTYIYVYIHTTDIYIYYVYIYIVFKYMFVICEDWETARKNDGWNIEWSEYRTVGMLGSSRGHLFTAPRAMGKMGSKEPWKLPTIFQDVTSFQNGVFFRGTPFLVLLGRSSEQTDFPMRIMGTACRLRQSCSV